MVLVVVVIAVLVVVVVVVVNKRIAVRNFRDIPGSIPGHAPDIPNKTICGFPNIL